MAEAKQRVQWEHTSAIQWAICAAMGNKNLSPSDFNPYSKGK